MAEHPPEQSPERPCAFTERYFIAITLAFVSHEDGHNPQGLEKLRQEVKTCSCGRCQQILNMFEDINLKKKNEKNVRRVVHL